jgi:hypothetical protein
MSPSPTLPVNGAGINFPPEFSLTNLSDILKALGSRIAVQIGEQYMPLT